MYVFHKLDHNAQESSQSISVELHKKQWNASIYGLFSQPLPKQQQYLALIHVDLQKPSVAGTKNSECNNALTMPHVTMATFAAQMPTFVPNTGNSVSVEIAKIFSESKAIFSIGI